MSNTTRFFDLPEIQQNINSPEIQRATYQNVKTFSTPVELDSDLLEGLQSARFSVAEPSDKNAEGVIVMPVPWSGSPERNFSQTMTQLMANVSGNRTIVVGIPGMGGDKTDKHNKLTEEQIEEARNGHMRSISVVAWKALQQNNVLKNDTGETLPVALWLNSLGTLSGSEMLATAPSEIEVADVYLSESIALREMNPVEMASLFALKASKHFIEYRKSNVGADIGPPGVHLAKKVVAQPISHIEMVRAASKGNQISILAEAIDKGASTISSDTLFHVIRAGEGLVRPEDNIMLTEFLKKSLQRRFGIKSKIRTQELTGEGHGFQDSFPIIQSIVKDLSI